MNRPDIRNALSDSDAIDEVVEACAEAPAIVSARRDRRGWGHRIIFRRQREEHDQLLEKADEPAREIAVTPGRALRMTKRLTREGRHTRIETLLEMPAGFQVLAHHAKQHEEAVNAFIGKHPAVFADD